jgi:hypothetical protein
LNKILFKKEVFEVFNGVGEEYFSCPTPLIL